jgi:hypothetical protein
MKVPATAAAATSAALVAVGALTLFAACAGAGRKAALPPAPANLADCVSYIEANHQTPEDYILAKLADHDVVILGEYHRIRHDPELVQALMPRLAASGVYDLAIEFAVAADQALIDRLVTAPDYDEALARRINFNALMTIGLGGYQEYCDLFKAAWRANRNRPEGSPALRVLALNDNPDWSLARTAAEAADPAVRQAIFAGCSEANWAARVKAEVLDRGRKVLCYCGIHHAFTAYRQPAVDDKGGFAGYIDTRFGNYLYREYGDRVFTIALHAAWSPRAADDEGGLAPAADGGIDRLIAALPPEKRRFGFDTAAAPMGAFSGETGMYSAGYPGFRLRDFCDGYVCQGPLAAYEGAAPIAGFVAGANLDEARRRFPNPRFRAASAAAFNAAIASDVAGNIRRLRAAY